MFCPAEAIAPRDISYNAAPDGTYGGATMRLSFTVTLLASLLALSACDGSYVGANKPINPGPTQQESDAVARAAEAEKQAAEARAALLKWHLDSYIHSVTGEQRYGALSVESQNTVSFGFPFEGEQRATLQLRGPLQPAVLILKKALFVCGIPECQLFTAFEPGIGHRFRVRGPDDGSTNYLIFWPESNCLARKLSKADKFSITATFYQEGAKTFNFDVSGLSEWPNMIPPITPGCDD